MKIRGNALHVAEKYLQLARDASSSGDRVAEQNYLQHAEHYYRIVAAAQAQMPQQQPAQRNDGDEGGDEHEEWSGGRGNGEASDANSDHDRGEARGPRAEQSNAPYGRSDPQPYTNGGGQEDRVEAGDTNSGAPQGADGTDASPPPRRPRRPPRPRAPRGEIRVAAEETSTPGIAED